jgi:hypothetical protein
MPRDAASLKSLSRLPRLIGLAVTLAGCVSMPVQRSAPTETEYIEVDYRRFVSGLYVNELKNKYVKINCAFAYMGVSPGDSSNYVSFLVTGPSGFGVETPAMLTVVIPKTFVDLIFSLRNGDQIQVRGRAIETVNRGARGSVVRILILHAHGIEKKDDLKIPIY